MIETNEEPLDHSGSTPKGQLGPRGAPVRATVAAAVLALAVAAAAAAGTAAVRESTAAAFSFCHC